MSDNVKAAGSNACEFVLRYEQDRWVASGNDFTVSGHDLPELESSLATAFRSRPALAAQLPVQVQLRFDYAVLPRWLRQYQAHYFNYALNIGPAGSDR